MQIAVLGGGSFGTAIANIVARNGHDTWLWMRDSDQVADVVAHGENRRYLPGHLLPSNVRVTDDIAQAAGAASIIFVVVPSSSFRAVCGVLERLVQPGDILISGTKGIDPDGFKLMSQLLEELTVSDHVGVLSGPNLAEEIADGHYTGTVLASRDAGVCQTIQDIMRSDTLRVYASQDVYGVELAGALKNIYAIVCGLAAGLQVGQNTIGMLITRALAEMSRFAVSLGGNPFTFLGLAGVGDLLVTCTSPLSRNYQMGLKVASGLSMQAAADELGKLAEGVNTLKLVHARAQELGVYMPLVDGLYQVLYEAASVDAVASVLMERTEGADVEFADPQMWTSFSSGES